jgi:hypothetical protein
MNLNESELEQELRLIRPSPASAGLEEKIAAALGRRELTLAEHTPTAAILRRGAIKRSVLGQWWQGLGWALAGAAAAVAVVALLEHRESATPSSVATAETAPASTFEPTESSEELVTAEDEGLLLDSDQEPVRQVRYRSLERHVWVNPQTGARMEFEVPREDVRFVSVAMQ